MAKAGLSENKSELFKDALELANSIPNDAEIVYFNFRVVTFFAGLGRIDEAEKFVTKLPDNGTYCKSFALRFITEAYYKQGQFIIAYNTTKRITETFHRDHALSEICALAKDTDPDWARTIALEIEDQRYNPFSQEYSPVTVTIYE